MASSEAPPASKKIKRTSFSPWSAAGGATKSASKKEATNPEPARIASDILSQANGDVSKPPPGLSGHPKILEMQKEWEKKQKMERDESGGGVGGDSRAGSAGTDNSNSVGSEAGGRGTPADRRENASSKREKPTAPALRPPPFHTSHLHKRPLAEVLSEKAFEQELLDEQIRQATTRRPLPSAPDPPYERSIKTPNHEVKAHARRFTEEAVMKQMAKLSADKAFLETTVKKKAGHDSPITGGPSMSFTTPTELLHKIKHGSLPSLKNGVDKRPSESPVASTADATAAKYTPALPPKTGDRLTAIPTADDGRLYSMYLKPDGTTESGRGCLFPSHYKHHDNPDHRFICPVRTCRRVFPALKGLGGHFSAGHCSTTYNDNGDGTLSKLGSYTKHGPGGSPGIVISRVPLGPDEPPPVEPSIPWLSRTTSADASLPGKNGQSPSSATRGSSAKSTPVVNGVSTDAHKYLHDLLHPGQRSFKREDVHHLQSLPRLRTLPKVWIETHKGSHLDIINYTCALAFLVGREVTGKAQCKAHTRHGPRPTCRLSVPCIGLPHNMNSFAKSMFSNVETCVGCKYWSALQRRSNTCDWSGQEFKPRGVSTPASATEEIPESVELMDVDDEDEDDTDTDTDSDSEPEPEPEPEPEVLAVKKLKIRKRKREEIMPTTVSHPVIRRQSFVQANVPSGPMGNADLEMEEWEVAPGRMRDGDGDENIAFSNSYLTSGNPVVVSEDVSFNVLVIKPGSVSHWTVEDDKLRTCSVASGKIKVTMGEREFQLGPNGMFVVRPGQTCKVENRIYLDSVVHCTTIADFETQ